MWVRAGLRGRRGRSKVAGEGSARVLPPGCLSRKDMGPPALGWGWVPRSFRDFTFAEAAFTPLKRPGLWSWRPFLPFDFWFFEGSPTLRSWEGKTFSARRRAGTGRPGKRPLWHGFYLFIYIKNDFRLKKKKRLFPHTSKRRLALCTTTVDGRRQPAPRPTRPPVRSAALQPGPGLGCHLPRHRPAGWLPRLPDLGSRPPGGRGSRRAQLVRRRPHQARGSSAARRPRGPRVGGDS